MFLYCDVLQTVKSRNRDSKVGDSRDIKDEIRNAMLVCSWNEDSALRARLV